MKLFATLILLLAVAACASQNNDPAYWGGIAQMVGHK